MALIAFLLRSSRWMVTVAILTGLFSGASSAGLIALIGWAINHPSAETTQIVMGSFVALAIVVLGSSILSQALLIRLAQQAVFRLRLSLSRQILASELAHLEGLGTPRLMATLVEDVQAVSDAVRQIPFLCIDLATVLGCFIYITWLSWQVLLLVTVLMVLAISSCLWLVRRGRKLLAVAREQQDNLFTHFRAVTEGTKELKLNYPRRQAFLDEELQPTAARYRRYSIAGLLMFAITSSWGKLIFFFAVGFLLFTLPQTATSFNSARLYSFIFTFTYLMVPMERLFNQLPVLSRASIALEKIEAIGLSLSRYAEADTIPATIQPQWQSLRLQGVTHTYPGEQEDTQFELGPIDLTLFPGELIFLVGGNGSGKSTLAKLITGLYIPESGEIWLGNEQITPDNREWYRQHFSAIFADFYLFDRLLGLESPDLTDRGQTYLKQLQLDHKVRLEHDRLSTTALSQGQRKRLALLTAYLEDRPLYLFDEWAANQDPHFKNLFYTQFLPQLRDSGKTVIVISHDDHYFYVADRIIKLDYGKVEYDKSLRG
ncbi:MAG TPA: cyclic peptide export ABC transporter [Allocoleopsis sp.]